MPSSMRAVARVTSWNLDGHRSSCDEPDCPLSAAEDVVTVVERYSLTGDALAKVLHMVALEFMLRLAGPAQQRAMAGEVAKLAGRLVELSQEMADGGINDVLNETKEH